ncbi:MAG: glycoside hydrolase family 70 protein [Streptococcus sp.]
MKAIPTGCVQVFHQFIKTQPGWNSSTENSSYDHLQGGQLLFNNSKGDTGNRTSYANSDYRLLNRTPTTRRVHVSTSRTILSVV